jgi:hypothetical protein
MTLLSSFVTPGMPPLVFLRCLSAPNDRPSDRAVGRRPVGELPRVEGRRGSISG